MNIKKALILCTVVFCTLAGSMGQTAPITYSGTPFKVNLVWQANTDKPANDLTQLPSVEGVNIVKKHQKPTQANPRGGIFELTKPIWIANVGIVNPTDSKKTSRIGYEVSKDGSKKRVYIQASRKEIK